MFFRGEIYFKKTSELMSEEFIMGAVYTINDNLNDLLRHTRIEQSFLINEL